MMSGMAAALGGLVMLANYNSARANYGSVYILQCILVVVLGGVSPTGGKGRISGVVLAIFLLRMLETGINRFLRSAATISPSSGAACCCWSWCWTTSAPIADPRRRASKPHRKALRPESLDDYCRETSCVVSRFFVLTSFTVGQEGLVPYA